MKLVARLKTKSEIEPLSQLGIDVFCVDTDLSVKKIKLFNIEEIVEIINIANSFKKEVYVNITKMIHETDLKLLNTLLSDLSKTNVQGIVISDLTVFVVAKAYNFENKIIFQPGTLNTDSYSVDYFTNRNIKWITLSRELTIDEINKIIDKKNKLELSIIGHGFIDMFYSKRKLLTNYFKHKKLDKNFVVNNYDFTLNEEIRENEFYPILEDEFGTHIFRAKKLISYDEVKNINAIISDVFIERIFMSDEEYYDSIKLYKNNISKLDFLEKYEKYDSGFYYTPTEKIKGDRDES